MTSIVPAGLYGYETRYTPAKRETPGLLSRAKSALENVIGRISPTRFARAGPIPSTIEFLANQPHLQAITTDNVNVSDRSTSYVPPTLDPRASLAESYSPVVREAIQKLYEHTEARINDPENGKLVFRNTAKERALYEKQTAKQLGITMKAVREIGKQQGYLVARSKIYAQEKQVRIDALQTYLATFANEEWNEQDLKNYARATKQRPSVVQLEAMKLRSPQARRRDLADHLRQFIVSGWHDSDLIKYAKQHKQPIQQVFNDLELLKNPIYPTQKNWQRPFITPIDPYLIEVHLKARHELSFGAQIKTELRNTRRNYGDAVLELNTAKRVMPVSVPNKAA